METTVEINAADVIELGNQQMCEPGHEIGAVLVGQRDGNRLQVNDVVSLGAGARPDSHQFEMDQEVADRAGKIVRDSGQQFVGIGHTHGPEVALREPSVADVRAAVNYPVCMLLKVDKDGGGRMEFFTGMERNLQARIKGLDGRVYSNKSRVPESCWKKAA